MRIPDGAGCSRLVDMLYSQIAIAFDGSAKPWQDAFFYTTDVDGKNYDPVGDYNAGFYGDPSPGTPLAGRGRDRVYTRCESTFESEGVSAGAHRARMRASIPGTAARLRTNEVKFTLTCPDPEPDTGDPAGPGDDASVPPRHGTTSTTDAAVMADDASSDTRDAGVVLAKHKARKAPSLADDDSGCNVARPSASLAWPLALVFAWLHRRRRGVGLRG